MKKLFKFGLVLLICFIIVVPAAMYVSVPNLLHEETNALFIIDNHDEMSHKINITVENSKGRIILEKTYNINPYETYKYKNRLAWNDKLTFKISLDDSIEEEYRMKDTFWNSMVIQLFKENNPISIEEL
jgi:hypothetical protein